MPDLHNGVRAFTIRPVTIMTGDTLSLSDVDGREFFKFTNTGPTTTYDKIVCVVRRDAIVRGFCVLVEKPG